MTGPQPLSLKFDLDGLKNIAVQGVRRAAAFIAIALNATQAAAQSLSLPSASMWRFFPEPVPEKLLLNSVTEFRVWVIGCALRELDAAFNDFLDRAWLFNKWSKLHGQKVRSDHKVETIEAKTNVGVKLALLLEDLGEKDPDTSKLRTLSNLRNCLTHARGRVTDRHANYEAGLRVMWLGLEIGFQQGEDFFPIPNPIPKEGVRSPDPAQPASIAFKMVERERVFAVGTNVSIEPRELHEICQFYLTSTDRVMGALLKAMKDRGVSSVPVEPRDEAGAT